MQEVEKVLGHEEVIRHLQNAVEKEQVSHSYIFAGEKGSGKKLLAKLFAMTLQCEEHKKEPCMHCSSCRKAMSRNHPDIIYVEHVKPTSIGIEDEAEKMTIQAQNALLKTIEEPPAYAVILLLANNNTGLLPTITSRCVTLNFKPVRDEVIRKYLMEELHVPDYQADVSVAFAQGNVGKAKQIATAEDFTEMMDAAFRILRRGSDMEVYEMVDALKNLSEQKHTIYEYLDLFLVWFRDVLLFKATKEMDSLVFKDEYNFIKERADKSSYEGLENIIKAIETAKARLQANVNFDLTMELLFLTIREN